MKLTEMEKDVLVNGITKNEYSDKVGDGVWSHSIADNCKATTKLQVSGVVSSLVKKGLITVSHYEDNLWVAQPTHKGIKIIYELLPDEVKR